MKMKTFVGMSVAVRSRNGWLVWAEVVNEVGDTLSVITSWTYGVGHVEHFRIKDVQEFRAA